MDVYYIDFLSKAHNFREQRKYFRGENAYEKAVKWAKKNFERYDPDFIKMER